MRLPALMAVVVGSLGLYFNGAEAARVRLPVADNPYCSIATYKARDVAEQAMSVSNSSGRPVIVVNAGTLKDDPSYGRFLMAHECCHHSLGHVNRYREGRGAVGPQPFFISRRRSSRWSSTPIAAPCACCAKGRRPMVSRRRGRP